MELATARTSVDILNVWWEGQHMLSSRSSPNMLVMHMLCAHAPSSTRSPCPTRLRHPHRTAHPPLFVWHGTGQWRCFRSHSLSLILAPLPEGEAVATLIEYAILVSEKGAVDQPNTHMVQTFTHIYIQKQVPFRAFPNLHLIHLTAHQPQSSQAPPFLLNRTSPS